MLRCSPLQHPGIRSSSATTARDGAANQAELFVMSAVSVDQWPLPLNWLGIIVGNLNILLAILIPPLSPTKVYALDLDLTCGLVTSISPLRGL